MNWSVEYAAILSPNENATALHGSWDLNVKRSLPEAMSQSLTEESADAVISFSESPAAAYLRQPCHNTVHCRMLCYHAKKLVEVVQVISQVHTAPLWPLYVPTR